MKLTLSSTTIMEGVNGVPHRILEGKTESGVPVKALIAIVEPQTEGEDQLAAFDLELTEVRGETQLVYYDIRLFL